MCTQMYSTDSTFQPCDKRLACPKSGCHLWSVCSVYIKHDPFSCRSRVLGHCCHLPVLCSASKFIYLHVHTGTEVWGGGVGGRLPSPNYVEIKNRKRIGGDPEETTCASSTVSLCTQPLEFRRDSNLL